jgi:transposase
MAKALPDELRERALEARETEGLSIAETAARFMIGTASVKRWKRLMVLTGSSSPRPVGGVRRIWIGDGEKEQLLSLVERIPDATIEELRAEYNSLYGTEVSASAMQRALQRHNITRKKRPSMPPKRSPNESLPPGRTTQPSRRR